MSDPTPQPLDPPDPSADPGWTRALSGLLWVLVPFPHLRNRRMSRMGDGLVALRSLFLTFVAAVAMIAVVVTILDRTAGMEPSGLSTSHVGAAVVILGLAGQVLARSVPRPLLCTSPVELVVSYRTRFFLKMAFSESAAMIGFIGFILTVNSAVYAMGLVFTAIGFVGLMPSASNLQRDQEALRTAGCPLDLVTELRSIAQPPLR